MASPANASATPQMAPQGEVASQASEKFKEIYAEYVRLKNANTPQSDPEFLKVRKMLQVLQQQQQLRKARHQHQQQQQLQMQQQQREAMAQQQQQAARSQMNGQVNANGAANVNGQAGSNQKAPSTPIDASAPSQAGDIGVEGTFTKEQKDLLRIQVMAFRFLTQNRSIPQNIQQQLFAGHVNNFSKPPPIQDGPAIEAPGTEAAKDAPTEIVRRKFYERFDRSKMKLDPISYSKHVHRSTRSFISSFFPTGVDVESVREERERIIYNRIMARRTELESVPANIASWDTSKSDAIVADDSIKIKSLIELKSLRLLQKQRELRHKISRDMIHWDNLAQTANRSLYRRQKKANLREARMTEELEKKQRDARASNEKKKSHEQMQAILKHGHEVRENALSQRTRAQKLGRLMQTHHQQIEKEEQKRIERTAKQRLQALKNDDEATYLKLLGQAKDSRISHLLKQTDGFLKQLAASVKQQQRDAFEAYGGDENTAPDEDYSGDESDDEDGPKVDYYQVAHRIREEVTEQAGILVGGTLKEYQVKGLQWMISLYNNNLNGILADEMGLGKTIQTISLVTYLIEKKRQNGPFLVIVPLSTLTNWNLEFEKWAPSVTRVVYKGPPNARKQQQQQIRYGNFQVLLTTYEYIIKDRPVLSKIKWLHMIVDEGHRMKNANSKLSSTLTQYYHSRYRLILTGTPLQNNLPELWALLNFVLPTIFKSVKSFDEWFNTPFANTGGQDRMELTEEEQLLVIRRLHKVLRPFLLRRLKKDVEKDLPDKQERIIKCPSSALQAKLYKQLASHSRISVSDGKGGKTGIRGLSNMLMQMRKVCNHPFVFEQVEDQMNPDKTTNDLIWRTAGKFELLDRVMPKFKATGHRILMFFQMTQIMNIMEDFLRLRGWQYLRLDGATKSDDRSELLRLFNAPNSPYFCFLLSTRAGGLGLNLQTADTVIIYDSDWNPHQDLQAQDRAHRIGQKNEVRILRLITSQSVEEKILERARYKLDMDGKVIQAGKFDNKSTNEERENLLRTLLDAADNMGGGGNDGDQEEMDDEDLNVNMARSDEELALFRQMDAERAKDPHYGPDKPLPRLMGESELPDIYLQEEDPVQEEETVEYRGRGARERTKVKYDDGLTEEQWLNAVDDDEDTIEAAIARKNARIEKRQTNKEKRARAEGEGGDDSSPAPSHQSSEEPEPPPPPPVQPKKRGRKSGVGAGAGASGGVGVGSSAIKRKAEEEVEETPPVKKKRGRQAKPIETLSTSQRKSIQEILNIVYQHLMDLEEEVPGEPSDDEEGPLMRGIIDPFIKLVPRNHYPDYYQIITNPIAMEHIQKKINRLEYQNLRDFATDMRLLCSNARTYNEDGSQLYIDANQIEDVALAKLKDEAEKYPDWNNWEDPGEGSQDGGPSSVATPLPTSTGPKLKLNFSGAAHALNGDGGD